MKMVLACGGPCRVSFPAVLSWELMSPEIRLLWKRLLEAAMNMHHGGEAELTAIWIKAAILGVGFPRNVFLVSLGNMSVIL